MAQTHRAHIAGTLYAFRAVPLGPILGACAIGIVGTLAIAQVDDPDLPLIGLRAALSVVGLGFTFAFDDEARNVTAALAMPLRRQRILRTLPIIVMWATAVGAVLLLASVFLSAEAAIPRGRLVLEGGAQALTGLFLAAVCGRQDGRGGRVAALWFLAVVLFVPLFVEPMRPWIDPSDPLWKIGGRLWMSVGFLGILGVAVASWDSRST